MEALVSVLKGFNFISCIYSLFSLAIFHLEESFTDLSECKKNLLTSLQILSLISVLTV